MTSTAAVQRVEGFEGFFDAHYDEVVRTLTLVIGDRDRADDAAQEAFAQAYRRWSSVGAMERPVGWVIVVGVNRLKRWIARGDRARAAGADDLTDGVHSPERADPSDHAETVSADADLHQALDRLRPRQRATVVLRYLCDLPTAEVAKALGCSPGTVKSALHSALANLRVDLEDDGERHDPGPGHPVPVTTADEEQDDHAT